MAPETATASAWPIGGVFRYEMMFVMGMIAILLPVAAICFWQSRRKHEKHKQP